MNKKDDLIEKTQNSSQIIEKTQKNYENKTIFEENYSKETMEKVRDLGESSLDDFTFKDENTKANKNSDNNVKWTKEQKEAICDRGNNLLVSASAGSGKTTVMTERIIKLLSEDKIPISNFLIVTFTSASAQDMKLKIIDKLSKLPKDDFILEQIDMVSTSDISDLHSFYSRLVSTYFYEVQIDPNFKIIDETEASYLKSRAIERVFETLEKQDNEELYRIFDIFQKGRKDDNLKNSIFDLSNFLSAHLDGENWFLENLNVIYSSNINENICIKKICKNFISEINDIVKDIQTFLIKCEGCDAYSYYFTDILNSLSVFSAKKSFIENSKILYNFTLPRLPTVKNDYKIFSDEAKALKESLKNLVDDYKIYFCSDDEQELKKRIDETKADIMSLFKITKLYNDAYDNLKREAGGLDFNDLEKYALKILSNETISQAVKSKYDYIFVDEYQDINEVQEKIISLLSRDNNRFMVGDLKQSIYRFRLCDPEIFLEKYRSYSNSLEKSKVIKLNCNFRSDKKILRFVDDVFSMSMTEKFGGINYENESKFVAGENNLDAEKAVNLCYIDTSKEESEKLLSNVVYSVKNHIDNNTADTTQAVSEARYVAQKITEIINDKNNQDKEINFSDFAVLVFARTYKILKFIDEIRRLGIPISFDSSENIMEKTHIQEIINFIKLCVCEKDDFLLYKVLKSKLFNFSDEEIVEIRKIDQSLRFYELTQDISKITNSELQLKLQKFIDNLFYYRKMSKILTIKELCKRIVKDFKLNELNLLEINGLENNWDIEKLISALPNLYAVEFFASYDNFSLELQNSSGRDAVQVMTVHRSKGMEFKYVFIINTSGQINYQNLKKTIITNKQYLIGMEYYDSKTRMALSTPEMSVSKMVEKRKMAEEQLRVLYVALTRAKEKLYVICSKPLNKLNRTIKLNPSCYSDWIEPIILYKLNNEFVEKYNYINFENFESQDFVVENIQTENELLLNKIDVENLPELNYAQSGSTAIPLKSSVSKMLKIQSILDDDLDDEFETFERDLDREFIKSSANRGTAYHKFFQNVDFSRLNDINQQINEILSSLTDEERALIDTKTCFQILEHSFFKSISNMTILKEREFFAEVSAQILDKNAYQGDKIILQGVIDLCAFNDSELYVLDYKTGKITDEKIEKYKFQLDVYSNILEKALNKKVTMKTICFIDEQKFVII